MVREVPIINLPCGHRIPDPFPVSTASKGSRRNVECEMGHQWRLTYGNEGVIKADKLPTERM